MYFSLQEGKRLKIKETEKRVLLCLEKRKLYNMRVMLILVVIDTLGTVLIGLENFEFGGRIETTQTTVLLSSA